MPWEIAYHACGVMKGALQMKFIIITIIMHAWPKLPEKLVFPEAKSHGNNVQWVTNLGVIGFAIINRLCYS